MVTIWKIISLWIISLFAFCLIVTASYAATIYVENYGDGTASLTNAQSAYTATSAGDIIVFPKNGTAIWSSALIVGKAITIDGNGTTLTASGDMSTGFFYINGLTTSVLVRITGFTFQMVFETLYAIVIIGGSALDSLRIDHNTFHNGTNVIVAYGVKGVIDNNYFYNPNVGIYYSAGTVAQANASWESMAAGTADAFFIEDNNFIDNADYLGGTSNERIGTLNGGKLVVRYNHYDSDNFPLSKTIDPFQAHGSAPGGVANGYWQQGTGARRGQSVIEFYSNTIQGKRIDFMFISRGGANLVHDNAFLGTTKYAPKIYFMEEEYFSSVDFNPLRVDWPAEDQVHNSFIWNNTYNGSPMGASNMHIFPEGTLIENRDYFLHEPQATGGKETFTGANGASGSYPTDGTTYPTLGTMVFTSDVPNAYYPYTPFTYPHPLRNGDESTTTTTSAITTHSLSGKIIDSIDNKGIEGVIINISDQGSVVTNDNGEYNKDGLPDGFYIVTPTQPNYNFDPPSENVTISGDDVPEINFTRFPCIYVWIQAESIIFDSNDPIKITKRKSYGACCDKYLEASGSGGETNYNFSISDGNYDIWLRVIASQPSGSTSFLISIGGESTTCNIQTDDEWKWVKVKDNVPLPPLPPGVFYKLTIGGWVIGTKLDSILITNDTDFPNDYVISGPGEVPSLCIPTKLNVTWP